MLNSIAIFGLLHCDDGLASLRRPKTCAFSTYVRTAMTSQDGLTRDYLGHNVERSLYK
jgi:hypothetical protein